MSGSTEHLLEHVIAPELKRIADALEVIALGNEVIVGFVKEAVKEEEERTRTVPAREVTKISSAPAPPRVPRARANL